MWGCFSSLTAVTLISMKGTINSFNSGAILQASAKKLMRRNSTFEHDDLKHRAKSKNTSFTKTRARFFSGPGLDLTDLDQIEHVWGEKKVPQQYYREMLFFLIKEIVKIL